jgi:hypothetical protein
MTISDLKHAIAVVTGSAVAAQISTAFVLLLFVLALVVLVGRALRWIAEDGPSCAMKWLDVHDRWSADRRRGG